MRRQSGKIKRREVPRPIQGHGSARARRRHHLLQDHINQTARRMDQTSARTCCNTTVTMTKQTKPSRHAEMRVLTHTHTRQSAEQRINSASASVCSTLPGIKNLQSADIQWDLQTGGMKTPCKRTFHDISPGADKLRRRSLGSCIQV